VVVKDFFAFYIVELPRDLCLERTMQNLFLRERFNARRQIYAALPNQWTRARALDAVAEGLGPADQLDIAFSGDVDFRFAVENASTQ
jgi:hypothetical protein